MLADLRGRTFRPAEVYLARWDGAKASDFGAPYADFLALSTLADAFKQQGERPYDAIRLEEVVVRKVATTLAQASQDDPRNTEVLDNLAVLFRVLGDERRASLARRLSSEVQDTRKAEPTQ